MPSNILSPSNALFYTAFQVKSLNRKKRDIVVIDIETLQTVPKTSFTSQGTMQGLTRKAISGTGRCRCPGTGTTPSSSMGPRLQVFTTLFVGVECLVNTTNRLPHPYGNITYGQFLVV